MLFWGEMKDAFAEAKAHKSSGQDRGPTLLAVLLHAGH